MRRAFRAGPAGRWLAAASLAALVGAGAAAPYTPADDADVVERLPARLSALQRQQRAEWRRDPTRLPVALALAQAAIERARRDGDPRELGAAQAALGPWWAAADAPPPVRLLRATIRQSQHDFTAALADLDTLLADPRAPLPVQAQAGLTRATLLQLGGRLAEAQAGCEALLGPRFVRLGTALSIPARACLAELRSLRGERGAAAAELDALAQESPADRWLALLRAELAQRMGDTRRAEALFRAAAAGDAGVYPLAAYADWLLDQNRPADALAVSLRGAAEADALLLRRAIALRRLGDARAAAARAALQARFAAARLRGDQAHTREEARMALELTDDAPSALRLALENWARQKEPADAVLLWRAARAAGKPAAAARLHDWVDEPERIDIRLTGAPARGARS